MECPAEPVDEGQSVKLIGRVVTGRPPEEPYEYQWEVSPSGALDSDPHGSGYVTLQTKRFAGQNISIKLRVKGLGLPGCPNMDTCTIDVRPVSRPQLDKVILVIETQNGSSSDPKGPGFPLVKVIVNTRRQDGTIVNGLRIVYVPVGFAGQPQAEKVFPQLSSPAQLLIPAGNYIMWALQGGTIVSGKIRVQVRMK